MSKSAKIITVVGARPQFVKSAVVSRALSQLSHAQEILVHTGQHYDPLMSDVFFEELDLKTPDYNLEIGSASHGAQTGRMLEAIEKILVNESPDWVLVYGDTNSTLAGALAASKLHIPIAHVEAGLRSYNRKMPEEINRVLTDHLSELLFTPTDKATENLGTEGISESKISQVGDVMYDASLFYSKRVISDPVLEVGAQFALATVHRAENTDDPDRLTIILEALSKLGERMNVIMPIHPRTRKILDKTGELSRYKKRINFIDPLGYLEMIRHEQQASIILTDSGGVQKEAYFFQTPCVTLRDETEWSELVTMGWNYLAAPLSNDSVKAAVDSALNFVPDAQSSHAPYGDGTAGEKIAAALAG